MGKLGDRNTDAEFRDVDSESASIDEADINALDRLKQVKVPNTRIQQQNAGYSFDNFSDLTDWGATSGSATTITTDSDKYLGMPTILLDADGTGSVNFRYDPTSAFDVSDLSFSLAIRPTDGVSIPRVRFDLYDSAGNLRGFRCVPKARNHWLRYDLAIDSTDGAGFDPTDIDTIDIRSDNEVSFYVSDLRAVENTEGPIVVFQFDDGHQSQYDNAFPILREYNMPATAFVLPERVEDSVSSQMTIENLRELRQHGWEIGSHTYSNLNLGDDPTEDEYENDVIKAKKWLLNPPDGKEPFVPGAHHFAYVGGNTIGTSADGLDIVPKYHRTASVTQKGAIAQQASETMALHRMLGDNASDVITALDSLSSVPTNTLVLNYHRVGPDGDISEGDFQSVVDKVDEIGAEVLTTNDLWRRMNTF